LGISSQKRRCQDSDKFIDSRIQFGYGSDSVQALQSTRQGIHVGLNKTGRHFKSMGIAGAGFPPQIPSLMGGKRFEEHIKAVLLREQKRVSIGRLRARRTIYELQKQTHHAHRKRWP